jgi:transposase
MRVRPGGIDKAGNARARRALIEGAWTYCMQARSRWSRKPLPHDIRDIAWKAWVRLCGLWRRLAASGKLKVVVTTAIAREMAGLIWPSRAKPQTTG